MVRMGTFDVDNLDVTFYFVVVIGKCFRKPLHYAQVEISIYIFWGQLEYLLACPPPPKKDLV